MAIQKARKYRHRLRVGLAGPTGSGKTKSALRLATAIAAKEGGRVGLIDTEHGTASLYADEFDFDVLELTSFAPDRYVEAINEFARAGGYSVLIVDSLTHAWSGKDGALEQVDKRANGAGGSFNAWRDVTPQHNRLVEALLSCPVHLIGTLRSKMAYEVDTDPKTHKVSVRKLGLQPIQREGMEYEFDVFADLDVDNTLTISKTRNSALSGYSVQKAGEELGLMLWEWAQGDEAPEKPAETPAAAQPGRPTPPVGRPMPEAMTAETRKEFIDVYKDTEGTWDKESFAGLRRDLMERWPSVFLPDKTSLTGFDESAARACINYLRERRGEPVYEQDAIDAGMAALADAAAREESQAPANGAQPALAATSKEA